MFDEDKLGDEYRREIGHRIKEKRTAAGYRSQRDYADASPFTIGRLKSWEAGLRLPPPWVLAKMAEDFGTSAAYLSNLEESPDQLVTTNYDKTFSYLVSKCDRIDEDGKKYAFQYNNYFVYRWVFALANGAYLLTENPENPNKGAAFYHPENDEYRLVGKVISPT